MVAVTRESVGMGEVTRCPVLILYLRGCLWLDSVTKKQLFVW
jgi:hypothetical protein